MMHLYKNNRRRGQTLVIAIMVMFILAVIAAVFIALVAQNLRRSERSANADAVAQIAEAGIRYADEMLTSSEDGADWRPIPDNRGQQTPGDIQNNVQPVPVSNWTTLRDEDPDFQWTRPYWPTELGFAGPTGGYTMFNSGQGRFLLRVSYNPDPDVALSKYIKIESVGRWGTYDVNDPTTWQNGNASQLKREITAFKPIGITDSLRFVTNKYNRSTDISLGVPGYQVQFGRSPDSKYGARGGPIRINGNLLWHGDYSGNVNNASVDIFLRGISANDIHGNPDAYLPLDDVEVAGDIKQDTDPSNSSNQVRVKVHMLTKSSTSSWTDNSSTIVNPSDPDNQFDTIGGFYKDGRDTTDKNNNSRGVKRIEPPLVDQPDSTNTTTRYRLLTLNSGERIRSNSGRWVNLGQLGWGRGVYINNTNDKQDESETLIGGYTLRADWLKPNNMMSSYWKGPYYVPPGAIITLLPNDHETKKYTDKNGNTVSYEQYYFLITRTDTANSYGKKAVWSDAGGNERPEWGATVRMPYPDPVHGRVISWYQNVSGGQVSQEKHIEGNGVIFAEGNVRVRGMLPPGMQLTIVSNQNIYIDGNVLKYRKQGESISPTDPYRGADPTCGLALLARQNVCVNTTQFFQPLTSISSDDIGSDAMNGQPPFHLIVRPEPDSTFRCGFEFGPYESDTGNQAANWTMYIRHSGDYGAAYVNAWLNPGTGANWGILNLNPNPPAGFPFPPHVWGVGDPNFGPAVSGVGVGSLFACNAFPLDTTTNASLNTDIGVPNILQLALDSNFYTRSNYWLGGIAVQPADVRIEAIIYAQEGSFFVIPGNWFNPNPGDVQNSSGVRPLGVANEFPYYGQPLDVRVIIDGAVSENMPAVVSDVEEWMAKWGRIPDTYGSTNTPTAHPGEGLTFLYDDHVGWPLANGKCIRVDDYGRPLPLTPKLPVSGSLIYFGDVM